MLKYTHHLRKSQHKELPMKLHVDVRTKETPLRKVKSWERKQLRNRYRLNPDINITPSPLENERKTQDTVNQ